MKYLKEFNNLAEAKAQGASGLDSPHVDIINGFDVVNYHQEETKSTFTCDFGSDGRMVVSQPVPPVVVVDGIKFTAEGEQTIWVEDVDAGASTPLDLFFSYDGETWTAWRDYSSEGKLTFGDGDPIYIKGSTSSFSVDSENYHVIKFGTESPVDIVSGSVMWLVNNAESVGENFEFFGLFSGATALRNVHSNFLPSTSVTEGCYASMFKNCTQLLSAPMLPATTLEEANGCYDSMFYGCVLLTNVDEGLLPATTLSEACYQCMFQECRSLSTPPALPATELERYCYNTMFYNCQNLQYAPRLMASTLQDHCYEAMFAGCSLVNSIACAAEDISAEDCTNGWVYNVASSGHFFGMVVAGWSDGESGIPNGWEKHMS